MEELINRLYEMDPQIIANSFVAIRDKMEKKTDEVLIERKCVMNN